MANIQDRDYRDLETYIKKIMNSNRTGLLNPRIGINGNLRRPLAGKGFSEPTDEEMALSADKVGQGRAGA